MGCQGLHVRQASSLLCFGSCLPPMFWSNLRDPSCCSWILYSWILSSQTPCELGLFFYCPLPSHSSLLGHFLAVVVGRLWDGGFFAKYPRSPHTIGVGGSVVSSCWGATWKEHCFLNPSPISDAKFGPHLGWATADPSQ